MKEAFIEKNGKITRFLYAAEKTDEFVTLDLTGTQAKGAGGSSSSQNINCIGKKSFADDTTLQRIVLPRTLETIEENAFENCKELQIVEMPCNEELTVQYSAFKNCRKLHTVDLSGAQALRIEAEAFADCDSLCTVVLPENCSISENAFAGCRPDILCFVAPKDSGAGEYAREHNYRFVENE